MESAEVLGIVRQLVLEYGQNPMSYLALESDKKYFFGTAVNGVIAYTVIGHVSICCGDMICKKEDGAVFLREWMGYCRQKRWKTVFLNVTEYFLDLYQSAAFGTIKYGEDACFDLATYTIAGKKAARARANINHATNAGLTVWEYKPEVQKDEKLEQQLLEVSTQWLSQKKEPEMVFMLGSVGLENPMDRRYFYAKNPEGTPVGFVVWIPFLQKKAYLADVTRFSKEAPSGVLDKIIYESLMQMKNEGVDMGSMGLSPLYNVGDHDKAQFTEKLFDFVYHHMNKAYDFQALHRAKEKYGPTHWENRYIVFHSKPFLPRYAYGIVRAQNPTGIRQMLTAQLPERFSKKGLHEKK